MHGVVAYEVQDLVGVHVRVSCAPQDVQDLPQRFQSEGWQGHEKQGAGAGGWHAGSDLAKGVGGDLVRKARQDVLIGVCVVVGDRRRGGKGVEDVLHLLGVVDPVGVSRQHTGVIRSSPRHPAHAGPRRNLSTCS